MAACPWLTSGIAAKLLDGDITVAGQVEGNSADACRFARQRGECSASIEILVGSADTHRCPQRSVKLKSLGNEAVQCRRITSPAQQSDIIAGRFTSL
jgi:hypothetical protein